MKDHKVDEGERRRLRGPGVGAKTVTDRAKDGPFGKTFLHAEIKAGRLKARKAGRATVILDDAWREYLESLPVVAESA